MPTTYILGPAIESVTEPEAAAPSVTAGRVGIQFHPTTPTEPGGKVHVVLAAAVNSTDVRPSSVHAVYVNPPSLVPPVGPLRTPEWFMSSGQPMASVSVPAPPVDPGTITVVVPGVQPGVHHVQTIMEYDS